MVVDACSWLHKGIFACNVKDLARCQRGIGTDGRGGGTGPEAKCAEYAARKAELLRRSFGINVLLVIDGDTLPSKNEENQKRRAERERAYDRAVAAERSRDGRAARRFYAQACSVTHGIKRGLIEECRGRGIAFLVAPYEADAQMARLAHSGAVDLVITEDSDILVYGCPRVLYKTDFKTGHGQEIQLMRDLGENASPSFRNFTFDMFVFSESLPLLVPLTFPVVAPNPSPSSSVSASQWPFCLAAITARACPGSGSSWRTSSFGSTGHRPRSFMRFGMRAGCQATSRIASGRPTERSGKLRADRSTRLARTDDSRFLTGVVLQSPKGVLSVEAGR